MPTVVTADIVGSRQLPDRAAAQQTLDRTMRRVDRDLPVVVRAFQPTVGDEQQAVFDGLPDALAYLLLLQLALPDAVTCRYGIGVGDIGTIASASGGIADGPGWWAAREAIETVRGLEQRTVPGARTWIVAHADEPDAVHERIRYANAYLLARDQTVSAMSERTRRLAYGRCLHTTQRELAAAEGITQSAVSQALAAGGAAGVVEGYRLLLARR